MVPSVLNVKDFGAMGDGAHDDRAAIQSALDALVRSATSTSREEPSCDGQSELTLDAWDPWAVAVYFPAGVYRLCGRLHIPATRGFRLFGDGGRWGGTIYRTGDGRDVPGGTVLRQDVDNEPIFAFEQNYTHGWAIERFAFTWANDQGAPPAATLATRPGAVGVWFSSVPLSAPLPTNIDYYNARISECTAFRGWRGVALDDRTEAQGGPQVPITLWGAEIASSGFWDMAGSAVRLANAPGRYFGMPSNALRDLYVVNRSDYKNSEPQIHVAEQGSCVMDSLDLEGRFHAPTLYAGGSVAISGLYFEHLDLRQPYYRAVYLNAGSATISGMSVDGLFDATLAGDPNTLGSIIHADACNLVLSGALGYRAPSAEGTGIWLLGGDAVLVTSSGGSSVHLASRPHFPNPRLPVGGDPQDPLYKYQVRLWDPYLNGTPAPEAIVWAEPVRRLWQLTASPLGSGTELTVSVPLPGARPGDLVTLGPPVGVPADLLVSGSVVANDAVRLWLFNAGTGPANPSGWWAVAAGNGFSAGAPQMVGPPTSAAFAPYPMASAKSTP